MQENTVSLAQSVRAYETTIDSEEDRVLFDKFQNAAAEYARVQAGILNANRPGEAAPGSLAEQLKLVWDKGHEAIEASVALNKRDVDRSGRSIEAAAKAAKAGMLPILLLALVAAAACGYLLLRSITVPMQRMGSVIDRMRTGDLSQRLDLGRRDEFGVLEAGFNRMTEELTALVGQAQQSSLQVSTSVTEIAATSRQQQATASETAATTAEIGATSREIFATSRDLLQTMNEVTRGSEEAAILAGSGQASLTRMEDTMQHVMEAAGSVNAKLAILNEKAGNINHVVTTITKVADQTNLLSLNAAIEAEKAGEYGRGFAVVATEIRRLADQTAVATYDIELMVKEIQSAVSAGVMGMDKFSDQVRRGMADVQQVGSQLSQIIQHVQALAPRFHTVNDGMQAQAASAEQINQALAQLSEAAQQTVESLMQSSQSIDELNQVSSGLRDGVVRFKMQAG
jgi:methyl-accepting chemotaxis protein WspA